MPSNVAPIQKFMWWDSAINTPDRGRTFAYTVVPVLGTGPSDGRAGRIERSQRPIRPRRMRHDDHARARR